MSPWRRAPRALYRVYDEDEYLAGEDDAPGELPPQMDARRSSRLLGLGLLVCVAASAVGLVALHLLDSRASVAAPVAVHGNQVRDGRASATERTSVTPAIPVAPATRSTRPTRSAPVLALPRPKPTARRSTRLVHIELTATTPLPTGYATGEAIAEDEFGFER